MKSYNIQQIAELSPALRPVWRRMAAVTDADDSMPRKPAAGRRISIVFPTRPAAGGAMALTVNEDAVAATFPNPGAGTYVDFEVLAAEIRALDGVQAAYAVTSATYKAWRVTGPSTTDEDVTGQAVEILFAEGLPADVSFGTGQMLSDTVIVDTTEGVMTERLRALLAFQLDTTPATVTIGDLVYTANGSHPGTDGANISVRNLVSGNNTPLSVTVTYPTSTTYLITVNLATDGAGAVLGTSANNALAVRTAVRGSAAAMELVTVDYDTGVVGTEFQTAVASTALSGGADASCELEVWALQSDDDGGGSGNKWRIITPAEIEATTIDEPVVVQLDTSAWEFVYPRVTTITGSVTVELGICEGAIGATE